MLSWFLGYRDEEPEPLGNVVVAVWSFLGALASLSLIYTVNGLLPALEDQQAPLILGSLVHNAPSLLSPSSVPPLSLLPHLPGCPGCPGCS